MVIPCDHCPIAAFGGPCPPAAPRCDDWARRSDGAIVPAAEAAAAPAYPPLPRQATNLAASLWDWATSGFRMAPAAEVDRRLAICRACPQYDAAAARCRLCGCFTQAKVRLKAEHCPLPEPKW